MACDESLVARIRSAIGIAPGVVEKKMFGGVAFMLNGNLCVGVHKHWLIARVDPDDAKVWQQEAGVKPFDITGRPMKGWLMVEGLDDDETVLQRWVQRSLGFVAGLPPK